MSRMIQYDIDYLNFGYPADLSLRAKLDKIPGFKGFMMNSVCALREKYANIEFMGNGLHVNNVCIPELCDNVSDICALLKVQKTPLISLCWEYAIRTYTEGAKNPNLIISSGAVDLLSKEELSFLIAHEIGHQACGHKPYQIFLETLYMPVINTIPGGSMWIGLVRSTLLNWHRMSDFTADRVGLLACQDINVALSAMIKCSGLPKKYYKNISIGSFIKQAKEFDSMSSNFTGKILDYVSLNSEIKPWMVIRAAKLIEWYNSDDYENLLKSKS